MSLRFWLLVSGCVALSACSALSTDVVIRARPLPSQFDGAASDPSAGQISWREFFIDAPLNQLITEALENSPDLLSAMQRIEIARAGVTQSTGALLPQVALSLGAGVRKFGLYTMDGAGNATTDITPGQLVPVHLPDFSIALQTSWEIDIWGKLRNQRRSAVAQYLATVEGTNLVITSLVADIAVSYYELIALDYAAELLERAVQRQEHALDVALLQKRAGRANELAVQQFEAQLANTRASVVSIAQQRVVLENRINLLVGRFPQPVERAKEALFDGLPKKLSSGIPSELIANRPDIREAEHQVEATQFDVRAARAAFFPNLNINAGIGLQAFNPALLFRVPESLIYSVFGGLTAPLFNWTGLSSALRGAKATQIQAMYSYQKTVLTAFMEVANGLSEIQNAEKYLGFKRRQQEAIAQSIETADLLFRTGKAGYVEMLLAQANSLQTDLEVIEAWRRQRVAQVTIYKALGGGWR